VSFGKFYSAKLAEDLLTLVKETSKAEEATEIEMQRWKDIRTTAKNFRRHSSTKSAQTPFLDRSPLGSERGLAATESIVDQDLTKRHMKI